jgi:3D (Asp-Asp-Asp) domain-containing protein
LYWGEDAASAAEEGFDLVHRRKEIPDDIPVIELPDNDPISLPSFMKDAGVATSNGEARRLIQLIGQDFTRPAPETALQAGDTIEVVRVTEDFRTVDEEIAIETVFQGTDQLEIDQRAVMSEGLTGILRRRVRVRYENGVETSQTADGEWVAREPVNRVVGYGTSIVIRVIDTPGGPVEYWRVVRMRVTAYTASSSGKPPDHPAYGITASGMQAGTGVVAVDPTVIPFRSWVYVPGYGVGFAGDTGGGVKGRWIDLGYDEDELQHWSGYVDVYYLGPVPPADEIKYLIPTRLP